MARKPSKPKFRPTACLVCGDKAIGINFNAATCMSCRAFFRRNAYRQPELKCAFTNACKIDLITRRFCTKCRLAKCFKVGMIKEWILTEKEKQMYRDKIVRNRMRRKTSPDTESTSIKARKRSTLSECEASSSSSASTTSSDNCEDAFDLGTPSFDYGAFLGPQVSDVSFPEAGNQVLEMTFTDKAATASTYDPFAFLQQEEEESTAPPPLVPAAFLDTNSCSSAFDNLSDILDESCFGLEAGAGGYFNEFTSFTDDGVNDLDDLFLGEATGAALPSTDDWSIVDLDTNETLLKLELPQANPAHPSSSSSTSDYLLHSLTTPTPPYLQCLEDPLVESPLSHVVDSTQTDVLFREIGFPTRELIVPEKALLRELTSACSVLSNPYHQIRGINRHSPQADDLQSMQHYFYRMIRMSKGLKGFSQFATDEQALILKSTLLEMVAIRSAILYHPDRKSWCFVDDKSKASVMIPMDVIRPYCRWEYQRHVNFHKLFRDEWKRDSIIFDLLTTIILFAPRTEYAQQEKVKEEHLRYTRLLSRYLEIKYPTFTEAEDSFKRLLGAIEEMRTLISDIRHYFTSNSRLLKDCQLFVEIFNLPKADTPAIS